ncbi:MAG: type II secretion system protein GspG [Candidatus Omnitrophota bacterium]
MMRQSMMSQSPGFTLGEMIIVIAIIAILASLITPLAVNVISQKRVDGCIEELSVLKKAIVGDPALVEGGTRSSFGFVGDIGVLPATLDELVSNTQGRPVYQQYGTTGMFYGWRGPYVSDVVDPWGNAYVYSTTPANLPANVCVRMWSYGVDGVNNSGNGLTIAGDDIYIDIRTDEAFSRVSGNTLDACDACSPFTAISIAYPNGTAVVQTTANKTTTALNPVYIVLPGDTFTGVGIPIGVRVMTFTTATPTTVVRLIQVNNGPMVTLNLKDPGTCN